MLLGLYEGCDIGHLLGSTLNDEVEIGAVLRKETGLSVGPLLSS